MYSSYLIPYMPHERNGIIICMKSTLIKSLALFLLAAIVSLAVWSSPQQATIPQKARLLQNYQTSSTRTSNVNNYCPANLDRTTLAPTSDISTAQSNMNAVRSQLGIDGNALMNKLLRGDLGGALSILTSNIVNLAFFIGPFLVPFLVFLIAWPFLCCCCCCPGCCPSKCCQQPQALPYTRCELRWPSAILILSLLLVISISAYGFSVSSKVGPSFQNMGCSLAIFTDDLLNGNVTINNASFFVGLNMFSGSLSRLSGNLTAINGSFSDLSNNASGTSYTAVNNLAAVQNNFIKKIPDNAGTANMNLVYNTPINAAATTGTLISSFAGILGKWNTQGTLTYNLYEAVQSVRLSMQAIKSSAYNFSTQIATIQSQITPMRTTIDNLISNVNQMDSSLSSFLSILNMGSKFGNTGMMGFYGFLIAFSVFSLIGVILTCCCDKPGCRNLMYFSCVFLFIAGIATFIIAVLFSFLVPVFTWTCDYLTVTLSSSAGFQNNFGAFLSNTTVSQISVCMPYGDGVIVNTVGGSAANGINNLTNVISSLKSFDNATLQTYINSNLAILANTANSYANGDISDLDTTNNNILATFSDATDAVNKVGCNASFTDSWVPSNNQDGSYPTAIPCKSTSGQTGSLSTCDVTFGPTTTCRGCMDTTQLLTLHASAAATNNAIKNKYGASCAFATVLGNAWTNYFNKKYTVLGFPTVKTQVSGSVMFRLQQSIPQINDTSNAASVFSSINSFRAVLNTANTNMTNIKNLTDPTYGMLAGLNCQLFGQDFVTFQNVICGSFYNNVYTIRFTFGIAAWGILFIMCCTVCSGVRHYKQIGKVKGNQISDSSMIMPSKNSFDEGSKRIFRGRRNKYDDQ